MFNARQYGIAQGSLIAKSIHQEDLQCNESSVNDRRKLLPPKIASAKAFSPGRGGRGAGRGGRVFVNGVNSHRGGGAGKFASSRIFHKLRSQIPNPAFASSSSSLPMVMMSNRNMAQAASGITHSASSALSHPRHFPGQPESWKGKAVMRTPHDKNPRPAKRWRMDKPFSTFEQPHRLNPSINPGTPDAAQGSRFPPGEEPSTHPMRAKGAVSTPVVAKNVKPPIISLITPPRKNANPPVISLITPPHGNLASYQQPSDRFSPHIATNVAIRTIKNSSSTTTPGQPRAMKRKREFFQNDHLKLAEMQSHAPPKLNPASPSSVKAIRSYRPPQPPKPMRSIDDRPKRPPSSSNVLSDDIKTPLPCTPATDPSLSPVVNAMSTSSLSSLHPPPHAPKEMMPNYETPRRPQPKSTEAGSTMSLSLVPRPSDVKPIPSDLTNDVKKESSPPLPVPKKSAVPSPPVQVKLENVGVYLTNDHRGSAEVKDDIVIKQEPDPSELIIPQRKLVTESCSFYPIPQNCRKSIPNYKDNRVEYFRKEYKRLREFGLTKQKVIFRDDGLAIEWTSPIPVWSDTLLPETSA